MIQGKQNIILKYRALDVQSLCVIPGKLVWKIIIDINIINHDGNVFDGCLLAALASYCSFKYEKIFFNFIFLEFHF